MQVGCGSVDRCCVSVPAARAVTWRGHRHLGMRPPESGSSSYRTGVILGLCAGASFAWLVHHDRGGEVRIQQVIHAPEAVSSDPGQQFYSARRQGVAPALPRYVATRPPPPPPAVVAVCVGGWLELSIPRRGASVREHVLSVMPSDVFVAGTVRGDASAAKVEAALDGIGALAPFAATSVIRMPSPAELRTELKKSGHWDDFKLQASKGGSGRFNFDDPAFDDPKRWVPIMMSPALGNPNGNTLQEFHYQSRCIDMIKTHERGARRGVSYERVMFTRLEFEWLAPHPPLALLNASYLWVPTGEDNTGVNDRHWLANRADAEGIFRRWDALVTGAFHKIFFATSQVRPAFMSSETYNKLHLQYRRVGVARFPNVAALQCCETSYAAGSGASRRGMHCFAKACHRTLCPRAPANLSTPSCGAAGGSLLHKYLDEGHSAIVHATALSLPGSRWAIAEDATPKRLHIEMGPPEEVPAAPGLLGRGVLYTCKTCEGGPDVPDPVSINVTSCLFRKHSYAYQPTLEAARTVHPCRYYDAAHMAALCGLLGDSPKDRMSRYGWWCSELELQGKVPRYRYYPEGTITGLGL